VIIRLFVAAFLGGIVGFEREIYNRFAGFRTHILVCVGSCLIMLTSIYMAMTYAGQSPADPGRLAAQVVSGIGFLGAGTILHSSSHIRGLTTAANLWMIAGVGLAVGSGFYLPAVFTTLLAFAVLKFFPPLEARFRSKLTRMPWHLWLRLAGGAETNALIFQMLGQFEITAQKVGVSNIEGGAEMKIEILAPPGFDEAAFLTRLRQESCVLSVELRNIV
jgi:putative Mg2+ transporter-C (MgtC) family protein